MNGHEQAERIVLAILRHSSEKDRMFSRRMDELIGLCEAAGGIVVEQIVQERTHADGALYLGSGKIEEVAAAVERLDADVALFDGELSPAQVRNLERVLQCRVVDRTQLILDIFALRAKSREGRLQVEMAQWKYLLPRLAGRGKDMSRQGGGIGTRGPGETRLETDRRRIRQRISHVRHELAALREQRTVRREHRNRAVPVVALVGYTNAGKSSMLQRWTADRGQQATEGGHNRLFDTLDPAARRVKAGVTADVVLLDTVGFVENLPHLLVDAFRSTLEEILAADVIVHVVDVTTDCDIHMETTYRVLADIRAHDKPVITFFNKMDMVQREPPPDVHAVKTLTGSALTGMGMERLYEAVDTLLELDAVQVTIDGLAESGDLWKAVSRWGRVLNVEEDSAGGVKLLVETERRFASRLLEQAARMRRGDPEVHSEGDVSPKEQSMGSGTVS